MFAKFGTHRSYGNRNIISYINSYMNTLEKIARTALVHHFENFQNHEYLFTTAKSPAQMAEKTGNKKKNTGNYKALRVLRKRKNNMAWRAGLI